MSSPGSVRPTTCFTRPSRSMSSQRAPTADLGDVAPARSRHQGRRSAVTLTSGLAVVGTADGDLQAFDVSADAGPLHRRWQYGTDGEPSVVAAVPFDGGVVTGERSARGEIRCHDAGGDLRWRYETRGDLGEAPETRFLSPSSPASPPTVTAATPLPGDTSAGPTTTGTTFATSRASSTPSELMAPLTGHTGPTAHPSRSMLTRTASPSRTTGVRRPPARPRRPRRRRR